jgi:hypothetical protein
MGGETYRLGFENRRCRLKKRYTRMQVEVPLAWQGA